MNPLTPIYVKSATFLHGRLERLRDRDDRGVSLSEYAALLVLVAGLVLALRETNIAGRVSNAVTSALNDIFSAEGGGGEGGGGGGGGGGGAQPAVE